MMKTMTEEQKKAMAEGRARKAAQGEVKKMNPLERAQANPKSTRMAINAKCWDCEGGDADAHVGWRIGNCTCEKTCGLYAVRPYQRHKGTPVPKGLQGTSVF
jgi:hypothetical protein